MTDKLPPIALIIGLCSHGLAMARALANKDIEVHAFEANPKLPGVVTNCAKVHFIRNIKSTSLVDDLLRFRRNFDQTRDIVLFPTNDNNVKIIANNLDLLKTSFIVSWANCSEHVLSLLLKSNIEARCLEVGLNYPKSFVVNNKSDITFVEQNFEFPVIAKPVNPQSGFKAIKCEDESALRDLVDTYEEDLPILVQHWITGTDRDLYFGALYLANGQIESEFVGKKLESYPPAMGQTTIAINSQNKEVLALTQSFFEGLNMSGPVSLELKCDHLGRYWVIEPTVGRTDFWVGLCVEAGCNLLYTEYQHAIGANEPNLLKIKDTIWFDSERDITAFPRHLGMSLPLIGKGYTTAFSYLTYGDVKPFKVAAYQALKRVKQKFAKRIGINLVKKAPTNFRCIVVDNLKNLPDDFKALLSGHHEHGFFNSVSWYDMFCRHVAEHGGKIKFYCMSDGQGRALAIMPMWQQQKILAYIFKVNWLTSLTNYYSPCYHIAIDTRHISSQCAINYLFSQINQAKKSWHVVDFFPLNQNFLAELSSGAKKNGLFFFPYWITKNYFQQINGDYEQYFLGLSGRVKNTIKRKRKGLTRSATWNIEIVQDVENIHQHLADYHRVYDSSWKQHEPYPDFISELIEQSAKNGNLRLGILTVDQKPVAAQLWLVKNKQAYIYKLAYDISYKQFSPGTLLTAAMFEHVIDVDKVNKIDFLTGNDNFKRDWMTESQELFGMQIINPRSLVGCYLLGRNKMSQLKKRLFS